MTWGRRRQGLALLGAVIVVGVLVLLISPARRTLDGARRLGGASTPAANPGVATPVVPPPVRGATPAVTAVGAVAPRKRNALGPDADGRRLRIPLTDEMPRRLPADGVPSGWELKEFTGRAQIELLRSELGPALRLRSEQGSFAVYRDVVVNLGALPLLSWSWKVTRLPAGGDVRHAATDDQAAQLYVVFPRWPSPRTSSDVIGYVWDTTAPVGTKLTSRKAGNVRIVVLASGAGGLGTWRRYTRNVVEDYVALFGRRPPQVGSIAIMVDANDTRSTAESWITDLAFSRS